MYIVCVLGLSVKQSTDISVLQQELERLDGHLKELRVAQKTRYLPKETKARLKEILDAKVTVRDTVARDTEIIKQKRQKLKVCKQDRLSPEQETMLCEMLNTFRSEQNGRHFTGSICKCTFFTKNVFILLKFH